jgi:uncharacterized repeat protein (TIGR01451 family)
VLRRLLARLTFRAPGLYNGRTWLQQSALLTTGIAFLMLALALAGVPPARAVYTSPAGGSVTMPAGAQGAATPYPSTIDVSGVNGSIVSVVVRLNGLSHTFPDDLDIVLVGPSGQAVMLMSDVGGATPITNVNLVFDATAASALPDAGPIVSGTYRPTNIGANDPMPAHPNLPAGPYGTALSVYNLTNPNGIWRLYVAEDENGSSGSLTSWQIDIVTIDLQATLASVPSSVNAGDPLDYNITVTNAGTDPVSNVTVTGTIPANTTFNQITPPGGWTCPPPASGASSFSCTAASFVVGAVTFNVRLNVDPATAPGTTLPLSVTISSAIPEANTANNSSSATVTVTTSANLEIVSLTAPASINAGENVEAVVTVRNNGPSFADSASLSLPLDTDTTFVALTSPSGWNCTTPAVGETGTVTCTLPTFTLTSVEFRLTTRVKPNTASGATIDSTATISSATTDPNAANNTRQATTSVTTRADLALTVSDEPDPVSAGAQLTYAITATNNGPSNASVVTLTTSIPTNTTFVGLDAPDGWTCTTPGVGDIGPITCTAPNVDLGNVTFTLRVRVKQGTPVGTTITLNAGIASATTDPNSANNTATGESTVTINADLSVTISADKPIIRPGETLTYTVNANNSGPEFANDVTLTMAAPTGTRFVSLQKPLGWDCTTPAVGASGAITCTTPALDVATDTFILTVTGNNVPDDITLTNTATITSPATDGNPSNNSATVTTELQVKLRVYLPLVTR